VDATAESHSIGLQRQLPTTIWVQSEVGVSSLPPLSERIGLKNKNATDYTDYTDSKSLAGNAFELERPGAEIEEQRQP
jgi:hypothetical protein